MSDEYKLTAQIANDITILLDPDETAFRQDRAKARLARIIIESKINFLEAVIKDEKDFQLNFAPECVEAFEKRAGLIWDEYKKQYK